MSQNDNAQDQPAPEACENVEQLSEDSLESVSGGIYSETGIDGTGCFPEPWITPPFYADING